MIAELFIVKAGTTLRMWRRVYKRMESMPSLTTPVSTRRRVRLTRRCFCLTPRETYDGTVEAQKFLSCVYRLREKSRFDFGVNQVAEVLTGAQTEKVLKWDHQSVSTYGIGKEHSRAQWILIGRELARLGYVRQLPEKFNVLQVTDEGRRALKEREPIVITKPIAPLKPDKLPAARKYRGRDYGVGAIECDEKLFDRLRRLRKKLADERGL